MIVIPPRLHGLLRPPAIRAVTRLLRPAANRPLEAGLDRISACSFGVWTRVPWPPSRTEFGARTAAPAQQSP